MRRILLQFRRQPLRYVLHPRRLHARSPKEPGNYTDDSPHVYKLCVPIHAEKQIPGSKIPEGVTKQRPSDDGGHLSPVFCFAVSISYLGDGSMTALDKQAQGPKFHPPNPTKTNPNTGLAEKAKFRF